MFCAKEETEMSTMNESDGKSGIAAEATISPCHSTSNTDTTEMQMLKKRVVQEVAESTERLKEDFMEEMELKISAVINDMVHILQKTDAVDRLKKLEQSPFSPPSSSTEETKREKARPRKLSVTGKLPEKVFVSRPSPLTELLQVTHFKTIHHIFIATLILIMLHTVILELVEQNTVDLGLVRLMWAFGRPQMTLSILLGLEFCGLVVLYPSFHFWSKFRHRAKPEMTKMIDYMAAVCFLAFLSGMICVPAAIMWQNPLPPASGATVTMEQCRLLMKMYAFVRANVPRVLRYSRRRSSSQKLENNAKSREQKQKEGEKESAKLSPELSVSADSDVDRNQRRKEDKDSSSKISSSLSSSSSSTYRRRNGENGRFNTISTTSLSGNEENDAPPPQPSGTGESWDLWKDDDDKISTCPSYSKYLYFYVAPTLIYKDNYPRTSYVRWDYVCWNFAQVLGCIVYANFILSRPSTYYFINFGKPDHPMTALQFCNAVFSLMLPGILGLLLGFFLLLHSWHNAFAEMLCFGDRLFYKDWWNCSSFHSYYKTWNILVHDWLYTYIFKDAFELGLRQPLPTILVFVISSLFHEYVLSFTFNFFFPVLLTLFGGFGLALTFVKNKDSAVGNIFMWFGLIAGSGILVSTYTMEFYARMNCPVSQNDAITDFFTPRFWSCNALVWK